MDKHELLEIELNGIIEVSNDNILITDGKGVILKASPNCEVIHGKKIDELIGKSVYRLENDGVFRPSITALVLKRRKEVQAMQTTTKDRIIMATGIPIFDEWNNIVRVITFAHDLTEIEKLKVDYEYLKIKMERYDKEIEELREKQTNVDGIVVKSVAIKKVWSLIHRMSKSDATVVLLGESGVGKSKFARALHNGSERKKEAFIEVNCGAIPIDLFESELFGYKAGAFTGASQSGKVGLIELAHNGTLFLDEIAEISLDLQVKLLKVLEEKKITRVGDTKEINVDFRIVAATNMDLEEMVRIGTFRKDLFYRINVVPITIPPLRDREDDIFQLVHYYLSLLNEKYETNVSFHSTTMETLLQYDWPGNVRELENLIERIIVTADTKIIYPASLPFINILEKAEVVNEEWMLEEFEREGLTLQESLQQVEKNWLKRAYKQCRTTYEMGEYLGLSQATVVRRLKKYNINSK